MMNDHYKWQVKTLDEIKALLASEEEVFLADGEDYRLRLRPDGQLILHWDGDCSSGEAQIDYNWGRIDLSDPSTFGRLWSIAEGCAFYEWQGYCNLVSERSSRAVVFPAYTLERDFCLSCWVPIEILWLGVERYFVTRCPKCREWGKALHASEITDPAIKERMARNKADLDKSDRDMLKMELERVSRLAKPKESPTTSAAGPLRDVDWSGLAESSDDPATGADLYDSVEDEQVRL